MVPFRGSCFKHVCHQQVWAEVRHGDELHLQDCHCCVLFPEQTDLSMSRQKALAGEVQQGLSSAFMSHPHHRECKYYLCVQESWSFLPGWPFIWWQGPEFSMLPLYSINSVSSHLCPAGQVHHSIAGREVSSSTVSPLEKGESSRNKEEQTEDDTVCWLYSSPHIRSWYGSSAGFPLNLSPHTSSADQVPEVSRNSMI